MQHESPDLTFIVHELADCQSASRIERGVR